MQKITWHLPYFKTAISESAECWSAPETMYDAGDDGDASGNCTEDEGEWNSEWAEFLSIHSEK